MSSYFSVKLIYVINYIFLIINVVQFYLFKKVNKKNFKSSENIYYTLDELQK